MSPAVRSRVPSPESRVPTPEFRVSSPDSPPPAMEQKVKATRKPVMPAYTKLSEEDLKSLVSYMASLKKK